MNEAKQRIKELVEQCRGNPITSEFEPRFDKEKFAELIIQKCVDISDDYVKDCTCEEHINCKHSRSTIGRKIREHFGVGR